MGQRNNSLLHLLLEFFFSPIKHCMGSLLTVFEAAGREEGTGNLGYELVKERGGVRGQIARRR